MAPPAEGADVAVRLFGGAAGGGAAAANNRIPSTRSQQAQTARRARIASDGREAAVRAEMQAQAGILGWLIYNTTT